MKRILIVAVAVLVTGCAQVGQNIQRNVQRNFTSSIDLAKQDCVEMGFYPNTAQYQNCVMTTTQNIRNVRAQESQASAIRANSMFPKTTTCSRVGSYIQCTEN
jgi:hypothetical protein